MGRKTLRLEKVEAGMKLASAVVTVSGQRLLAAGALLDNDNIALLKKAGIRYVQIFEQAYDQAIDTDVFRDLIQNLDKQALPAVGRDSPQTPTPVTIEELLPPAPPSDTREVKVRHVKEAAQNMRQRMAADRKKYAEKMGEQYTTVSYTLGEPSPRAKTAADAPFVDLMGLLARNMADKLIFERRVDEETTQILVRDVISELSNRANVMQLLTTAYSVSRYLLSHMMNVSLFSMRIATEMKLTSEEVTNVVVGAMLHDIGMVLIPVGVWNARRDLSPTARTEVQRHTELGAHLIRETPNTREEWATSALEHHERLDGSGYPMGKQAGQLSIAARIIQIADVYEAMTADRSYRYAKFPDVSMKHILGSPDQFDRDIAQVFCKCLGFYPEGYTVKLSTGEQAVVLSSNPKNVFRPIIRLQNAADGSDLPSEAQLEIDLNNRLDMRIVDISNRRVSA